MEELQEWGRGWNAVVVVYFVAAVPFYITLWKQRIRWLGYFLAWPFSVLAALGGLIAGAIVQEIFTWKFGPAVGIGKLATGVLSLVVVAVCGVVGAKWLGGRRFGGPDRHVRGTHIVDGESEQRIAKKIKKKTQGDVLSLAGVAVAFNDEPKHFKLLGVTGTGKSTAVAELMGGALPRGDRAIFADPDGGYLNRFYDRDRGDQILNPFDPRSVMWDLFGEIQQPYDIEGLAHSLIAEGEGSAREWRGYARVFLSEVIRYCHERRIHDLPELWRLLAVATNDELRSVVAGTPAQPFLEPDAARMFGSIRGVCASSISAFRYLKDTQGEKLSVRQWIQRGRGALFLPYAAGQIAALSSVIATWVRLGIFETMNRRELAPGESAPMWFVVDELDALGAIDGLKDALARLRKFDGRCVLGFQSIAQVSSTYGEHHAQTIIENCGNTLILRCSASKQGGTSEYASRLIGDREVLRTDVSASQGYNHRAERHTSQGESLRHVTERAVMPSEIEQLPDLAGYLKLASSPAWMRVQFPVEKR